MNVVKLSTAEQPQEFSPLFVAHAQWVKACARVAEVSAGSTARNFTDEEMEEALDTQQDAEWRMIRTPAVKFADLRLRAAVLQGMVTRSHEVGRPTDGRDDAMLNTLVREIGRWTPGAEDQMIDVDSD